MSTPTEVKTEAERMVDILPSAIVEYDPPSTTASVKIPLVGVGSVGSAIVISGADALRSAATSPGRPLEGHRDWSAFVRAVTASMMDATSAIVPANVSQRSFGVGYIWHDALSTLLSSAETWLARPLGNVDDPLDPPAMKPNRRTAVVFEVTAVRRARPAPLE
jgi:hypothetical protein